jgi:hypothetical protein
VAVFSTMNMILHHVERGVWLFDPIFRNLLVAVALLCGAIWFIVRWTSWLPAPKRNFQMDAVPFDNSEERLYR